MPSTTDTPILALLFLLAVSLAGILMYVATGKLKARREQRNVAAITTVILDYFKRSGVMVNVDCTHLPGRNHYTAFIESEPMKRFRLSHIIEMTLREHVRKSCALELGKIYWRFPIYEAATQNVAASGASLGAQQPMEKGGDEYINEGLEHYKYIPKVEATELPWEHFEKAAGNTDSPQQSQ